MKYTNIKLSLRFIGENFDIQEITNMLNVYPSETWNKGDFIRKSQKKRQYTAWIYSTDVIETLDINKLITNFKDLFYPKDNIIIALKEKFNLDISIDFVVIIENEEPPAIYFLQDFIEFAAKIGATFDIDIYIN